MKIRKLSQLKIIESFIQANFVKGYSYIDKAGELVNKFHINDKPPIFSMNLDGLVILDPDEKTKEIKISPLNFWAHYVNPNSLDQIAHIYSEKMDLIHETLRPEGYSRLGWRNYFIAELDSEAKETILNKFVLSEKFDFRQSAFSVNIKKIECLFNITSAFKKGEPEKPALLIDVDSFVQYSEQSSLDVIKRDLKIIRQNLGGNDFLKVINTVLEK